MVSAVRMGQQRRVVVVLAKTVVVVVVVVVGPWWRRRRPQRRHVVDVVGRCLAIAIYLHCMCQSREE